jgi:hypothetical protein
MAQTDVLKERFFPRDLGLAPAAETLRSGRVYEFLAVGKDEAEALSKLLTVMSTHKAKLYTSGGYSMQEPGNFVWTAFADFAYSDSSAEDALREVRRLSFVTDAEASKIGEVVFEQFLFPVFGPNHGRAVILRAEPFMHVEQRLIQDFGSGGAGIMFEEGKNYALEIFGHVLPLLPKASADLMIRNAVAGLRATGWGIFEFDVFRLEREGVAKVSVREPLFSATPNCRESFFTNGIASGVLEGILKIRTGIQSSSYEEKSKTLHLVLKRIT